MAISTAAAIIGSAVVGAGASAYSSSKAAKSAKDASNYAADQNAQVSREIYNQTRTDLAPYNQAGQGALSALMVRLGITPMNATNAPPPSSYGGQPAQQASSFGKQPDGTGRPLPMPAESYDAAARTAQRVGETGRTSVVGAQGFGGGGGTPYMGPGVGGGGAPAGPGYNQGGIPGLVNSVNSQAVAQGAPAGVDYAKLFQDRPDVMAEYNRLAATADKNSPWYAQHGLDRGPEGFADWWLQNKPAQDTYSAPKVNAAPSAPAGPQTTNGQPAQYFQESYAQRPEALAPPTFQRPNDLTAPTSGPGPSFSWNPSDIANDAGYKFEVGETTNNVNAGSAARGMLRSGDAAKALQDRLFGVAHTYGNDYFNRAMQGYNANRSAFESDRNFGEDRYRFNQGRQDANFIDDRSYGTNLWNTLQGRQDNIFSEDRGFQAGRFDQGTSNLFGLAGMGQNAAAAQGNAGNVFANNMISSNNQRAASTANAALANGQNMTNLFGSAAGALGTYYGMRGR